MKNKDWEKDIVGLGIGIVILWLVIIVETIYITKLKNDNFKLITENNKLKQEIIDYKWQLDQVPYVIDYWCKGE